MKVRAHKGTRPKMPPSKSGRKDCGIVMPISALESYTANHWRSVLSILMAAAKNAGFEPGLVSEARSSGVILQRILGRLASDPVIVCDISGKNANVMLELGMRLAFGKMVVIVKDDKTECPFDISAFEYVQYPKNLKHASIVAFQKTLGDKLKASCVAKGRSHLSYFLPEVDGDESSASPLRDTARAHDDGLALGGIVKATVHKCCRRELARSVSALVLSALSTNRDDRRWAHILVTDASQTVKRDFLRCMQALTKFKLARIRGEAYYCLGELREQPQKPTVSESFLRNGLIDESVFVQACCANVLQRFCPLSASTVRLLRSMDIDYEASKARRHLLYYVRRTLAINEELATLGK